MADNQTAQVQQDTNERGKKLLAERSEAPLIKTLTLGLGAITTLIVLTWAVELWLKLGFEWFDEQAMISCLGITLAVIFIRYPFSGGTERDTLPWYDAILAVLSLGACGYLAYFYGDIELNPFAARPTMFNLGIILLPLVWEALQ